MYSLSQVRKGLKIGRSNPAIFGRELNRLYYSRLDRRSYNPDGIDVLSEDWDNLLILDACRYDLFEQNNTLSGQLERRISRGSHTVEFLQGNFANRDMQDTVYITASPQFYAQREQLDAMFFDVVNVWIEDGWDESVGTVLPETMTRRAIEASEQYPDKRLIVHYLQPHYPFINAPELNPRNPYEDVHSKADIWGELMEKKRTVAPETVWEAYSDNLRIALPAVEELMQTLLGRTVVTSDHGNMIGERSAPIPIREWGHPPGIYTRELVTVPWLVYDNGDRKEIVAGESVAMEDDVSSDVVSERLEHLGYVE
ncbi:MULTISPECIES: LTA synthase family protein [Haloferax]|uniref:Sulfatase N-terminal domain-containing protein n=1 Tax=Haloferax marinum TaxID=2666143 RepID=A0A6A8GAR1_9EURY|nr:MULTISPECIES: LTA synthase family protein [Haloferax]KAB1191272.1 LTA synthase family protein [Haloferax sp. CBA1150]MRW98164.1 hypothetical protein [Haloferax marinum]